ncbi:hypothetical protein JCM19231_1425 [Vibrio ishigakensis]|uniref:Uncharacterized protein n=1 Tax=Vibrio ishigakensis TaxID=1481914 RepID=A0A0B8P2R8_9VIBR|nr:hypothetical protein JCM19231_1425 [Vibrio ishigakensis]
MEFLKTNQTKQEVDTRYNHQKIKIAIANTFNKEKHTINNNIASESPI